MIYSCALVSLNELKNSSYDNISDIISQVTGITVHTEF